MQLCVISHKNIYLWQGHHYTYGGFPRQMEALRQLFGDVLICAPIRYERPPEGAEDLTAKGLQVARLPYITAVSPSDKLRFALASPVLLWRIWRAVREAEVVQVRIPNYVGVLGALVMRVVRKPTFVWLGGDWPGAILSRGNSVGRRVSSSFFAWFIPRLLRGWDVFVPEPDVLKGHGHLVKVVPVVNTSLWRHELPDRPRERFPLSDGRYSMLFVGRLESIKGVHILLQSLAELSDLPWYLTVVGDGEQRRKLEALAQRLEIAHRVAFVGRVPRDNMPEYYMRADIVVVPSLNEMSPKVALEAMGYRALVIASRVGALPRLLGNGRGILVDAGQAEQIVEAIRFISRSPKRTLEMQHRAWQFACDTCFDALNAQMGGILCREFGLYFGASARGVEH